MKINQFLLGLLILVAIIEAIPRHKALRAEWDTWKKLHSNIHNLVHVPLPHCIVSFAGKSYASKNEENKRLRAYVKNSIFIANHNLEAFSGKHSYYLKMNQFGDMVRIYYKNYDLNVVKCFFSCAKLHNEFLAKFVGKGQSTAEFMKKANISSMSSKHITLPRELDWRSKGAVTPVKNQGYCPFCSNYFAAVSESRFFLDTRLQFFFDLDWSHRGDPLYQDRQADSIERTRAGRLRSHARPCP